MREEAQEEAFRKRRAGVESGRRRRPIREKPEGTRMDTHETGAADRIGRGYRRRFGERVIR